MLLKVGILICCFGALDSRQISSGNIHPFLQLLAKSIKDLIVSGVHEKMSFRCHILYGFLKEKFKGNAIRFENLQNWLLNDAILCQLQIT